MPLAPDRRLDIDTLVALRAVAPPEAPYPGALMRDRQGQVVFVVDRDLLEGWPAWDLAGCEHVWAPRDLVRTAHGHAVVLPVVQSRADRLLARRAHGDSPLSDGERVTLAVSLLRGTTAALAAGLDPATSASWWVTPDGEPLLVCAHGDDGVARAATVILDAAAEQARAELGEVLTQVAAAVSDPRTLPRRADALEDALFAAADAEPLVTTVLPAAGAGRGASVDAPAADASAEAAPPADARWWLPLARAGDRDLADQAWAALGRVRAALRGGGRRRPMVVAAAAAGVVVLAGLAWPQGEADPARADPAPTVVDVAPDASAAATGGAVDAVTAADPVAATAELLSRRRDCPDGSCWGETQEDPADQLAGGAIDAPAPDVVLVDDFGGLAVLRVNAEGAAPRLVTVVTTPEGWRLRDAFDAAQPPA
ncbi:hypothetical protein ACIQLJ_06255 [Microbacterium sp. NPDC091313]